MNPGFKGVYIIFLFLLKNIDCVIEYLDLYFSCCLHLTKILHGSYFIIFNIFEKACFRNVEIIFDIKQGNDSVKAVEINPLTV